MFPEVLSPRRWGGEREWLRTANICFENLTSFDAIQGLAVKFARNSQ